MYIRSSSKGYKYGQQNPHDQKLNQNSVDLYLSLANFLVHLAIMKITLTLLGVASLATAFPHLRPDPAILERVAQSVDFARRNQLLEVSDSLVPRDNPLGISKAQTNCGPTPCTTFSEADQFITTSGQFAYQSPSTADIRGPCPGLNAAANHGYLPRSGIATIEQSEYLFLGLNWSYQGTSN